jgi:hypothetical protein
MSVIPPHWDESELRTFFCLVAVVVGCIIGLFVIHGCSFTAIRYEDPDCSKCADISKVTE